MHRRAYFWGNASWNKDRHFCPNEAIHWYAMRYWKQHGMECYDLCGAGAYKRKYGCQPFDNYFLSKSKHTWITLARKLAFQGFRLKQHVLGMAARRASRQQSATENEEQ
jgi:hypothetical protein